MSRAQLSTIFPIVVEGCGAEAPVLIADEFPGADDRGIELHLELDVLGDGFERGVTLADQDAPSLLQTVEVKICIDRSI